jgi:GGDEF domain-containing protein
LSLRVGLLCQNPEYWSLGNTDSMSSAVARDILGLDPGDANLDSALKALLDSDPAFAARLLTTVSLPGLGRRSGIELDDLRPLFGLRFVQQVAAGLLLEDAGADATGSGILAAIAAQCIASKISLAGGEEVFLAAWLNSTPAWRQAPASWGPGAPLAAALDRHSILQPEAQLGADRFDLVAQVVRLGELLVNLASPYPDASAQDAFQRAARVGLAPHEIPALLADVAPHAAEWAAHLGRALKVEPTLDINAAEHAVALRLATELAQVYRYLRQNAAIDAASGLPNFRYFRNRLEGEWAAARRRGGALSVIAIEYAGEAMRVARTLRDKARLQDVVCRTGESQFMLICVDAHAEFAEKVALRMRHGITHDLGIAANVGVASLDNMISSVDDLMERARQAAREAEVSGSGFQAWAQE